MAGTKNFALIASQPWAITPTMFLALASSGLEIATEGEGEQKGE
jgi:hypothetical protein